MTRRTGRFDGERETGDGTLSITSSDSALSEEMGLGFDPFEYRLVDGVYWHLNTVVDPPTWLGGDRDEVEQFAEGDLTLGMDGDIFLETIASSITEVIERDNDAPGGTAWTVRMDADDLAPLVLTGGAVQGLLEAAADDTGVEVALTLEIDDSGMIVAFNVAMDEWWSAVLSDVGEVDLGSLAMAVEFELGGFDNDVVVDAPCDDPVPVSTPGEPAGMTCEAP